MPGKAVFAASPIRIAKLLEPLHRVYDEFWDGVDGGQTYVCYISRVDGSFWHLISTKDYSFPGRDTLVRGEPVLDEILDCICASTFDDEVALATIHINGWESFDPLLSRLESLLEANPTKRQLRNAAMSVACSASTDAYNHRGVAGKTMAEIDADYGYFVALAARASNVRARAEAALGFKVKATWARRH